MTEEITNVDSGASNGMGKNNKGINVLTILTFIGSGIAAISAIMSFSSISSSYEMMKSSQDKLSELGDLGGSGGALGKMMEGMGDIVEKSYNNRYIILLVALLGVALCVFGAIKMRKGSVQGLYLWTVGEWIPVIAGFAIVGSGFFTGFALLGAIVPVIFTILYFVHKKYLA